MEPVGLVVGAIIGFIGGAFFGAFAQDQPPGEPKRRSGPDARC